jgi:hypothetical protein
MSSKSEKEKKRKKEKKQILMSHPNIKPLMNVMKRIFI